MAAEGNCRNVLIAMDGSEYSDYAFDWYWENVHRDTDKCILLHVPEYHTVVQSPMVMADVTVITDLMHEEEKRIKTFLEGLGDKLKHKGVQQFEGTQSYERVIKVIYHLGGTLEGLSIGTPKTINIPFGTNGKLMNVGGKVKSVGGNPGEVICKVADEEGCQLIVTGTRGMGKIRRTFLGSISDYVIHHSHVPVLVTRHKDHHAHHGHGH